MRPEAACCVVYWCSRYTECIMSVFYSFECTGNSQGMGICFPWNSFVGMEGFWSGVHVCLSVGEARKQKQAKGLEPLSIVELECPLLPRIRRCMQEWLSCQPSGCRKTSKVHSFKPDALGWSLSIWFYSTVRALALSRNSHRSWVGHETRAYVEGSCSLLMRSSLSNHFSVIIICLLFHEYEMPLWNMCLFVCVWSLFLVYVWEAWIL